MEKAQEVGAERNGENPRVFGYARVSVGSGPELGNLETQRQALLPVDGMYTDVASGGTMRRPGLRGLLGVLRPGDTVKVVALDRLGRSLPEVLQLMSDFRERGVELVSQREAIDQSTAVGRAMTHLVLVFAEMERGFARERSMAGQARARKENKRIGRPPAASARLARHCLELRGRGASQQNISELTGLNISTVRNILNGIPPYSQGEIYGSDTEG